jgi:hypothetical protein
LIHLDGNYSWNLKCSFEDLKKNAWFDFDNLQKINPNRLLKIKKGVEILNQNVISIDTKISQVRVEHYSDVYIPGHSSPPSTETFLNSYKECFCAVINETRFAQPFGYFSEKTTTAMQSRLPVIIVAPPRTLEYLRTFGFKTFDRWWDESYDQCQDPIERINMVTKILENLCKLSNEEIQDMLFEMEEILEYNYSLFYSQKFINLIWDELKTNLSTAIAQVSLQTVQETSVQNHLCTAESKLLA